MPKNALSTKKKQVDAALWTIFDEHFSVEWDGVTAEGIDENGEFVPPWER